MECPLLNSYTAPLMGKFVTKHWKPVCISTLVLLLIDGVDLGNYKC